MKKQQVYNQPSREPSRTLIRIEDINIDAGYFHVILPGWNTKEKIKLLFDDVSIEIQTRIKLGQLQFHARVNIGCECKSKLFFIDWETE